MNLPFAFFAPAVRRLLPLVLLAGLALAGPASALTLEEARHLVGRTGLGVTPAELARLLPLSRAEAVDLLLGDVRTTATSAPPAWVDEPPPPREDQRGLTEEQRREKQRQRQQLMRQRGAELKAWWWGELLATDAPLTERMTLFWHNHFTSSMQKVKQPQLLYRQNVLLRRLALGNFRDLAYATSQDPAMILYLDGQSNHKGKPNENYARELLELFTLGEGHYTEQDIKQAARAFTGYGIDPQTGEFVARAAQHDFGAKTFMGHTGDYDGNDIIDLVLAQPACAEYLTGKLWREFVSPTPDPQQVERLAEVLRAGNYELKPLLRALLLSDAFWAPANRGTLVKSPAELIAGTLRTFGMPQAEGAMLAGFGRRMGQDLLDPPNVKGWLGGEQWIDSNTLLVRRQFIERLERSTGGMAPRRAGALLAANDGEPGEMMLAAAGTSPPGARQRMRAQQRAQLERLAPQGSPVRARMDALRAEGKSREEIRRTIRQEVMAGTLEPSPAMRQQMEQMRAEAQATGGDSLAERASQLPMPEPDWDGWITGMQRLGAGKDELPRLLLATPPTVSLKDRGGIAALHAVLLDPAYQLK